MIKYILLGIKYKKILPKNRKFLLMFEETRINYFLNFSKYFFPPLFAFCLVGIYYFLHHDPSLTFGFVISGACILLFIIMLYYRLGKFSQVKLTNNQVLFYQKIANKNDHIPKANPNRFDLFLEINHCLKNSNKKFLDDI